MKRFYILLLNVLLFAFSQCLFSQNKVAGVIAIDREFSTNIFGDHFTNGIVGSLGFEFNESFRLLSHYKHNSYTLSSQLETRPKYHFIGIDVDLVFSKSSKTIRPLLHFQIETEILSNWSNKYLGENSFEPSRSSTSFFYYSTPLMLSINSGISVLMVTNLKLNLLMGFAYKAIKYRYLQYSNIDDMKNKIEQQPIQTTGFLLLNAQIGLSYSFPFKKQTQSQ